MLVVHVQVLADGPPIWADRIQTAIDALFTERFWALFAFLFGVGFALQIERWGDKPGIVRIYLRRLLILAGFAIVIAAFTGYRVLLGYAFWGLVLLAMRRWSDRALVVAAVVIALAAPAISAVRWQIEKRTIGVEASNQKAARERGIWRAADQEETRIKQEGTFPQLMTHRLQFELGAFVRPTWYIPGADLLMFVLGLLAVRRGVLRDPAGHRRLLIVVVVGGLILPQLGDLLPRGWIVVPGEPLRLRAARIGGLLAILNPMFQGLAYGAALLLWTSRARGMPRLCAWLAHAGPDVADQLRRADLRAGAAVLLVSASPSTVQRADRGARVLCRAGRLQPLVVPQVSHRSAGVALAFIDLRRRAAAAHRSNWDALPKPPRTFVMLSG